MFAPAAKRYLKSQEGKLVKKKSLPLAQFSSLLGGCVP